MVYNLYLAANNNNAVLFTPALNPGEGGRSESSSVDPGKVPSPPVLSGLPHPETLWEGPLYWTLSIRGSICGTPSRSH